MITDVRTDCPKTERLQQRSNGGGSKKTQNAIKVKIEEQH